MKISLRALGLLAALWLAPERALTQAWLDKLDESLFVESSNGLFRADLSGLLDLEGYYVDQRPPGLLFGADSFFNPRLSFFLDLRLGRHFYAMMQARIDRGFDPRAAYNDARFDEYFLRYMPFEKPWLNLQIGKFATVVGNWVPRHDSWNNPFITAPLPYENVLTVSDQTAPGRGAFLGRRNMPDNKAGWLPTIWGPAYTTGASVSGSLDKLDYAFEFKNASISSRPAAWDATEVGWDNPTVSGRVGYRPSAAWNVGASFSYGAFLLPAAKAGLLAGSGIGDFKQLTVGQDISFAWHQWQFWAEAYGSRFEVPNVGDADTLAYYLEAKYKFTPQLFGALRWNQQLFDEVPNGVGGQTPWDNDVWRMDAVLGYRFTRHIQSKLQYSYSHQKGVLQQGEQLVAAQITVKF